MPRYSGCRITVREQKAHSRYREECAFRRSQSPPLQARKHGISHTSSRACPHHAPRAAAPLPRNALPPCPDLPAALVGTLLARAQSAPGWRNTRKRARPIARPMRRPSQLPARQLESVRNLEVIYSEALDAARQSARLPIERVAGTLVPPAVRAHSERLCE